MITLKELKAINFRSWEKLELKDIDKLGTVLIQGHNGSGKSSIRMAIEYLVTDEISDILVDEIPKDGGKNCEIYGLFYVNEVKVEIYKYRNHFKHSNKIFLIVDGDDSLTHTDRRETQKEIDKLFSSKLSIFTNNSVSFVDSKDTDRKKILYDILDLDRYNLYYKRASDKINTLNKSVYKIQSSIDTIEDNLLFLNRELNTNKNSIEEFDIGLKDEVNHLTNKLSSISVLDYSKYERLIAIQNVYNEIDSEELLEKSNESLNELKSIKYSISSELKKLYSEEKKLGNCICPVLNNYKCEILKLKKKEVTERCDKSKSKLNKELKQIEEQINGLEKLVKLYKKRCNLNNKLLKKRNYFLNKIERIKDNNKNLEERKSEIKERITEIHNKNNPYIELENNLKSKISENENKLEELNNKRLSILEEIKYYEFWKLGYSKSGAPNMIIEDRLESIEAETNNILSKISDDMFVEIKSQTELKGGTKEKISYKVFNGNSSISSYHAKSGGEKQRVKVADMFAFSNLISKFSFIVLDEVLEGSLDDSGKDSIIELLNSSDKTLLVVSHDDKIKDSFNNIITIKKENEVSKIV